MDSHSENVNQLVDHLFRQEFGRMVSRLTRILGASRLATAEDAVQYAMLQALQLWPYQGVPEYPQAWLAKVAYHRTLDILKSERKLRFYDDEKEVRLRNHIEELQDKETPETLRFSQEVADEQLALIFMCCHPALPHSASVAITLKMVCGFGVAEIARAFLTTETAITQRLVRAKRMIRDEALRCEVPDPRQLDERLGAVLEVLYLLFTEGYAATAGDSLVKHDLCAEAIRLGKLLAENSTTSTPECHALLALMLFQAARLPARTDALGDLLLLEEQDRSLWDKSMIHLGLLHLQEAARGSHLSTYHLQAEIAAMHSTIEDAARTDWENILALYDLLWEKLPTPVVLINRAVAIAQVKGPAAGLEALKAIPVETPLEHYPFLDAAEGEFHRRLGNFAAAEISFRKAQEFARTEPQQRFLLRKIEALRANGKKQE
jgi:RNA polymerase sigma factor (sigma-70 family)